MEKKNFRDIETFEEYSRYINSKDGKLVRVSGDDDEQRHNLKTFASGGQVSCVLSGERDLRTLWKVCNRGLRVSSVSHADNTVIQILARNSGCPDSTQQRNVGVGESKSPNRLDRARGLACFSISPSYPAVPLRYEISMYYYKWLSLFKNWVKVWANRLSNNSPCTFQTREYANKFK